MRPSFLAMVRYSRRVVAWSQGGSNDDPFQLHDVNARGRQSARLALWMAIAYYLMQIEHYLLPGLPVKRCRGMIRRWPRKALLPIYILTVCSTIHCVPIPKQPARL